MDGTPSLSDIAAVTRDNDGAFGGNGGWMWIVVIFLFAFMGGGFGWGNRGAAAEQPVTEAGLCNAMNFNNLENAVGRLSDQTQNQTMTLGNGICNLGYEIQGNIGQLGKEIALGQANLGTQIAGSASELSRQLAECCCNTQRGIDSVNYNNAINTAAINANIDAKFAAMEKSRLEQTIAAQQAQINQLNLQAQLCGVVRYPMSYSYTAGQSPFCGGCGCNGNV